MAVIRKPTISNPIVVPVDIKEGEYLHFEVAAAGPIPIFSFISNTKGPLWETTDFSEHPTDFYEWDHLRNPSDIQQLEVLTLALAFFTNVEYTYKVNKLAKNGDSQPVLEISYEGKPTDSYDESLRVILK